jgi:hypothetical protein
MGGAWGGVAAPEKVSVDHTGGVAARVFHRYGIRSERPCVFAPVINPMV